MIQRHLRVNDHDHAKSIFPIKKLFFHVFGEIRFNMVYTKSYADVEVLRGPKSDPKKPLMRLQRLEAHERTMVRVC